MSLEGRGVVPLLSELNVYGSQKPER